uniref:Uncharacterized protein n=1 Tax=Arundo donax TaxID=35708 RepID=A0A0A9FT99_ARUDO
MGRYILKALHLWSRKGRKSWLLPARYGFSDCAMTTGNTQ